MNTFIKWQSVGILYSKFVSDNVYWFNRGYFLYFRCEFTNKTQMFPFCIDVEDKFEEEVSY